MLGFFAYWRSARNRGIRVNQLSRVISCAAHLAVITILIFGMAFWALAFNKTIRQKHVFYGVVKLFNRFSRNFSVGFEFFVNGLR